MIYDSYAVARREKKQKSPDNVVTTLTISTINLIHCTETLYWDLSTAAVETVSLWEDFMWTNFDFCKRRSIQSVFESCGRHIKRLSFPGDSVYVRSLPHCDNVIRLSLPSFRLNVNQLRIYEENAIFRCFMCMTLDCYFWWLGNLSMVLP